MAARARELASSLGVLDQAIIFNDQWVPYNERGNWLSESDIGVSAHFADVETHFAFRTQLLDYLWAGLPIVSTRGDVLGDLVETHSLGRAVGVEDVEGWISALDELLDDTRGRAEARDNATRIGEQFTWPRVARPLLASLAKPGSVVASAPVSWLTVAREREIRARLSREHRGNRGIVRHAVDRAVGHVGHERHGCR